MMPMTLPFQETHGVPQEVGEAGHSEVFDLGELLSHHILDAKEFELFGLSIPSVHLQPIQLGGLTLDMSPSKHLVLMLMAATNPPRSNTSEWPAASGFYTLYVRLIVEPESMKDEGD